MPRIFLPSLVSALLLWAAFFPLNLGALGFVALVPWLSLVRAPVSRRRRYFAAYVGGFAFFALATNWVRVAHPMMYLSWAGLSLVFPLFWLICLDLIRRFDRLGVPLALSVPVVWVALEYFRMHFPTGFPFLKPLGLYQMIGFGWYFLGYTQHEFLQFIQISDIGGVYAVSFLVATVNGLLADWLFRAEKLRSLLRLPTADPEIGGSRTRLFAASAFACVLLVAAMGYGDGRLDHPAFAPGPIVAALQGSVPQMQKNAKGDELEVAYAKLHWGMALKANPQPDLIVWPETCFAGDWLEVPLGQEPSEQFAKEAEFCRVFFSKIPFQVPVLVGLSGIEWEGGKEWRYNSALYLTARGAKIGRYDKMHLVPFGEYVPFKETFPFMHAFTPYEKDYSCRPGERWTRFSLTTLADKTYKFACLICYEDSDPYLARQYVATDPVDFLTNISNDGWFDGTEEHEQHLAICRFRAIEARRAIVRSVNMGISALLDSDGRIVALPRESWSASKKISAVLSAEVPIDNRDSPYSHLGDWIPATCWMLSAVAIVLSQFGKRLNPNA